MLKILDNHHQTDVVNKGHGSSINKKKYIDPTNSQLPQHKLVASKISHKSIL